MALIRDIPVHEQHEFLDLAKEFDWIAVKQRVSANPALVCVQPCGRWSALHQAAYGGSTEAVTFLLRNNADPKATNSDGKIPLDVAKTGKVKAILRKFVADQALTRLPTPSRSGVKAPTKKLVKANIVRKATKRKTATGKHGKTLVYKGRFEKTKGGLTKEKLMKNKAGRVVSTRMHERGKAAYKNIRPWVDSLMWARKELGISGFVAVKKGLPLYAKILEHYRS